jgi:SAM-dependent methyltransferase
VIERHRSHRKLEIRNSVYKKLGIEDINAFYADKFVWSPTPNIVEHDPASRYDIRYLKPYWIFDRVTEGAAVLDVGCGSGTLNLLKSKKVYLVGADLSEKGLKQALLAGYDHAVLCDGYDVPYPDKTFDYIVSLDVLGHIENEVKDVYLAEWVRLLKDDGAMLHGIEAVDVDYDNLSEELRQHYSIDGHAGLESFRAVQARFQKFFLDVTAENCMGPCLNWLDIEKYPITEKGMGKQFRDYLLAFTSDQIKAFNAAMLLMRSRLLATGLLGESGGFMFIEARKKRGLSSLP